VHEIKDKIYSLKTSERIRIVTLRGSGRYYFWCTRQIVVHAGYGTKVPLWKARMSRTIYRKAEKHLLSAAVKSYVEADAALDVLVGEVAAKLQSSRNTWLSTHGDGGPTAETGTGS
jgi:hypothetical protein